MMLTLKLVGRSSFNPIYYGILFVLQVFFTISTASSNQDFYSFNAVDIRGNDLALSEFRGKVSLVVNVASQCGFTDSHYKGLVKLHDILSWGGFFTVLGFPCNQFGEQEPDAEEDIELFVKDKYKADFPLFSKVNVIGSEVHSAWKNLAEQSNQAPDWNFWKYLVGPNGRVIKAWGPSTSIESIFDFISTEVEKAQKKVEGKHEL